MKKLDSLMQMLATLVPADKTDVFCDEGVISKSQPRALSFKLTYFANIFISDFTANPALIFAHIGRWIIANERKNSGKQFDFEVDLERETEAFIAIRIELEENVAVIEEEEGGLIIDVC